MNTNIRLINLLALSHIKMVTRLEDSLEIEIIFTIDESKNKDIGDILRFITMSEVSEKEVYDIETLYDEHLYIMIQKNKINIGLRLK